MSGITVIGVDWSGARGDGRKRGIWVVAITDGRLVFDRGGWSRRDVADQLASTRGPVLAGLDFSFGLPVWFARERNCESVDDVWRLATEEGERWLSPEPPFWRDHCDVASEQRFRACEERLRAVGFQPKSVFQLVGAGQVGPGSVRGMPILAVLRARGFAVWPFDAATERTIVEAYPSALRTAHGGERRDRNDRADATIIAETMWEHRDELMRLEDTTDPVTRLEGEIWVPR